MNISKFIRNLSIILTITAKDILDAIKNKTAISILITMLFIIMVYKFLPNLSVSDIPSFFLYDADHSIYTAALENDPSISVRRYMTFDEFKNEFRIHITSANLGLVLPVGFDQDVEAGEIPQIQGYVMHWVNQEQINKQRKILEDRITAIIGSPVRINTDAGTLTMLPQSAGGFLASAGIVIVIIFMGLTFIPYLIVEEKSTRTIDALLVSPARNYQIVIAKALAGLVYCGFLVILVIILNSNFIIQWDLALFSVMLITLMSIALGLILGTQLDNPQQVRLVASFIMVPLFLPVFLSFMVGLFPTWLINLLGWFPSVAASDLIRISFTEQVDFTQSLTKLGLLVASIVFLFFYEVRLLRRTDR
jgi:hypothetical protein